VERLVEGNRWIMDWVVAAGKWLSRGSIFRILHEHILLSIVSARCVPWNFFAFEKYRRSTCFGCSSSQEWERRKFLPTNFDRGWNVVSKFEGILLKVRLLKAW
jgi:hypothetical protein